MGPRIDPGGRKRKSPTACPWSTSRPGIWKLKDGGYFVRVRVTDPRTGERSLASSFRYFGSALPGERHPGKEGLVGDAHGLHELLPPPRDPYVWRVWLSTSAGDEDEAPPPTVPAISP